jgi:hypothetical protein
MPMSKWTKKQIESAASVVGYDNGYTRGGNIVRARTAISNGLLTIERPGSTFGPNGQMRGRLGWSPEAKAAQVDL